MINLVAGKYYETRGGQKIYCIGKCPFYTATQDQIICSREGYIDRYFPNGKWMAIDDTVERKNDIIKEIEND